VLKITRIARRGRVPTVKVEGEIRESCAGALREACATPGRRSRRARLDLSAVHYVDAEGVQLLRDLMDEGVEIAACSGFVSELLYLVGLWKPATGGAPESSPPPPAPPDCP